MADIHGLEARQGLRVVSPLAYAVDPKGKVTRYNPADINQNPHPGDNGRVVGYDNALGFQHRHYFGVGEPIDFISYEDVEERFELDWTALKGRK